MQLARMRQLADMSLSELRQVLIRDIRKIPTARVKKQLWEYQRLQTEIDTNLEQIQVLRSRLQRITVVYKDAPGSGPSSDKEILVGKVRLLEKAIQADTERMRETLDLIRFLIDSLDNYLERQVLDLRYVRGWKDWQKIAEKLDYTESHIKNVHGVALKKLIPLVEVIHRKKVQKSTKYCDTI